MVQPSDSQSSYCVWDSKTQIALGVGLLSIAAVITGIVLVVMENLTGLGIGVGVIGGCFILADILYLAISCRNQKNAAVNESRNSPSPLKEPPIPKNETPPQNEPLPKNDPPKNDPPKNPSGKPTSTPPGVFKRIGLFAQMDIGEAFKKGDLNSVRPDVMQIFTNWELKQSNKEYWTESELATDLGVTSKFVQKVIENSVEQRMLTKPANGRFSKETIIKILDQIKQKLP